MTLRFPSGDRYQDGKNWANFTAADHDALGTLLISFYKGTATFDAAIAAFSATMKARGKDAATRPVDPTRPV